MSMDNREGGFCNKAVEFGKFPVKHTANYRKNGAQQGCIHVSLPVRSSFTYTPVS